VAKIEAIKGSVHIMPVIHSAAEKARYIELNQVIIANDFAVKRSRGNDYDNDRTRRTKELLRDSDSPEEALITCASTFDIGNGSGKGLDSCFAVVETRSRQYADLCDTMEKKLKQGAWLLKEYGSEDHYVSWKNSIRSNRFGDLHTMDEIFSMINKAENLREVDWTEFYSTVTERDAAKKEADAKKKEAAARKKTNAKGVAGAGKEKKCVSIDTRRAKPEGDNAKVDADAEFRRVANELIKLTEEIVVSVRSLRLSQSIRDIQNFYTQVRNGQQPSIDSSCVSCKKDGMFPDHMSLLSQCGHLVCHNCLTSQQDYEEDCPVRGCNATNQASQYIYPFEFDGEDVANHTGVYYGRKVQDIIHLIKQIPEEEQILVFVQYNNLMGEVRKALCENDISFASLTEGKEADVLTDFQNNEDVPTKKKLLLLNLGESSAAGRYVTN
jgi:hypothetical protein